MFVVRIRENLYCRGFFFKKYNENFVETLETVCNIELSIYNREVSILRGSTVV